MGRAILCFCSGFSILRISSSVNSPGCSARHIKTELFTMATTILTTNLNTVFLSTASDATFLVPEGTIRNSNTDDAIQIGDGITNVANVTLWVDGAVYGNDDGIVTDTANNVAIHVGSTGVVRASSTDNIGANGIELGFSSNIFIANAGQISGDFAIAAQAGADTTILNSGLLTGVSKGVEMGIGGFLDNSGEIRGGTERGVDIRGDGTVENSGLIAGQTDGIFAITSVALTNNATGVIRGQSGVFADSGDIVNHGEIASTGNGFAVDLLDDLNSTANSLTNTGQISGDVGLGTGADLLNNSGVITGDVFLEDGDDTYEGLASGVVNGKVFGMGGA
ncbi:hypothetical protein, partial [uncultured Roseovarius sp.]|uniref:hypothetical protein n=1 Tax=uncultured Roseovarius sp. TaxID=293344 RepID=UPI00262AB550